MIENAERETTSANPLDHLNYIHASEYEKLLTEYNRLVSTLKKERKIADALLKQKDKEINACHKEAKKVKTSIIRWGKRSWLKRAFHRLRVHQKVKPLILTDLDQAGWDVFAEKAKTSASELHEMVKRINSRSFGKWCLELDEVNRLGQVFQKAEQAFRDGKLMKAVSHWRKIAITCNDLIVRARQKPFGLWCVRKKELVHSRRLIKSLLKEKSRSRRSKEKPLKVYPLEYKNLAIRDEHRACFSVKEGIENSQRLSEISASVQVEGSTFQKFQWWPLSEAVFPAESLKNSFLFKAHSDLMAFVSSDRRLSLQSCEQPVVSIVVPVYNKPEFLYQCLKSINETLNLPYEVIVWDDASKVDMTSLYDKIDGVKFFHSTTNLNFVLAVNEAVKKASGEYVVLLNSDAFLQPESVSSSVALLAEDQRIGAVGACLILPDGRVQEAGCIVWKDGSCAGIGRGLHPEDSRLQYCRVVDYCSGAFLVTRRDTWIQVGGFDPDFAPAYYEETDFCLRLKKRGLLTVYNPAAKVSHYEFGTNGVTVATDRILLNRDLFLRKHADLLSDHFDANDWVSYFRHSRQSILQERWLCIDDLIPRSVLGAGFPRAREILASISGLDRQVTFVPVQYDATFDRDSNDAVFQWLDIVSPPDQESLKQFLMDEVQGYDVICVSRPHNKRLLDRIFAVLEAKGSRKKPVIIYDAEAIFAERDILKYEIIYGKAMPGKNELLLSELVLTKSADIVMAVTEKDKLKFQILDENKPVLVLGHTVEIRENVPPFEDRAGLLFVGPIVSDCTPNADSIYWMIDNVLPRLRKKSSLVFKLVGSVLTRRIYEHLSSDFVHLGPQKDVRPFYDSARVFVCPTRYAAGMPLKMVEAMSAGVPVVCTSLIAGQMNVRHEEEVLIADSAEAFTDAILRLHSDAKLWHSLQAAAYKRAWEMHSSQHFHHAIQQLCLKASNLLKERN